MSTDNDLTPPTEPPSGPSNGATPVSSMGELSKRIVFGVVLAAVALGLLWAGPLTFAVLILVATWIMVWEWGRVVRGTDQDITMLVHGVALTAAVALAAMGYAALGAFAVLIGAIIVALLQFGGRSVLSTLGVFYTGLPAVALLWLRSQEPNGLYAVLFLFVVVWATDIFAYLAGRLFGGPKFAPRISPKKTWTGFLFGVMAATVAGWVFASWIGAPAFTVGVLAFVLAVISQLGDLAESALKRRFNLKDSSQLIPGHGGFLDRLDSLVPVAMVAALLAFFLNAERPAEALLFLN